MTTIESIFEIKSAVSALARFSSTRDPSVTKLEDNIVITEQIKMSIHIIPADKLSHLALQEVIEEFISRCGTDYGAVEASLESNFRQVKLKLENGLAVLVFDDETETTNIFLADDPILKSLTQCPSNQETIICLERSAPCKKLYSLLT